MMLGIRLRNTGGWLCVAPCLAIVITGCSGTAADSVQTDAAEPTAETVPVVLVDRQAEPRIVGFRSKEDLFECYPGDAVALEDIDNRKAMRWTINYASGTHRGCVRELESGTAAGAALMRFKVRSDSNAALWVQVNENSGEGFFQLIEPRKKWKAVTIRLSEMKLNDDKPGDRRLDVDQISKVLVVDAAGVGGKKGKRNVWFADWEFASSESDRRTSLRDSGARPHDKTPLTKIGSSHSPRPTGESVPRLTSAQLAAKVESVLPTDDEQRWLRIPWHTNLMQARVESQRAGKPMLIWIMDGHVLGCT